MSSDGLAQRCAHFKRHYLPWIVLRHFLSADLVEELCIATVEAASEGKLAFETLFERQTSGGPPALASWVIRPQQTSEPFARYLQRLIRGFVWQNDDSPGTSERDLAPAEVAAMREIEIALELSHRDLDTVESVVGANTNIPEPLLALVSAMTALKQLPQTEMAEAVNGIVTAITADAEEPLTVVLVKHLGDLCCDVDRWDVATALYDHALLMLTEAPDSPWCEFLTSLRTIILQSCAAAVGNLEGPSAAYAFLVQNFPEVDIGTNLLAAVNVTPDLLTATAASREDLLPQDRRSALLIAPQLLDTHSLGQALQNWSNGKYPDAHRRFWAVLRRQTALGSATYSRYTKGYYGRSMVDQLRIRISQERSPDAFWLATRLLIESGLTEIAEQTTWTEGLVETYVTTECISKAIAKARIVQGATCERMLVTLTLFEQWLQLLPPSASEIVGAMLRFVAATAKDFKWTSYGDRNLSRSSMEVLKEIGRTRPEFRTLEIEPIVAAIIAKLEERNIFAVSTALETASTYIDVLGDNLLRSVVGATMNLLAGYEVANGPWPVVRPALELLSSSRVMQLCDQDTELGRNVTSTLLRFSLETATENTSLLFLLRDLNPALIDEQVDVERLNGVVSDIRKRAGEINSSASVNNIMALLVAPAVSRADGVRDAIDSLMSILQSAGTGDPSISFSQAYRPVMLLTNAREDIARHLSVPSEEVTAMVDPLIEALVQVWRKAPEEPLIFSGFAFPPPTLPNPTLVHNWTFASIGLARSLGREREMLSAMEIAARHPALETSMAVARAIRVTAGDPEPFNLEAIGNEKREAFYPVLGQRLVLLNAQPPARRAEIVQVLLEQCFRLGPKGLDAGVFSVALQNGITIEPPSQDARAYRLRLDNNPELRLSLVPMFENLLRLGDGIQRHE